MVPKIIDGVKLGALHLKFAARSEVDRQFQQEDPSICSTFSVVDHPSILSSLDSSHGTKNY